MNIGIIGAGITGLSAAYELIKNGHQVTVFERSNIPGGLGTYIPVEDTFIERYYHHFFESDTLIKQYAQDLGIADKLHFYPSKNAIYRNNTIFPFSSPFDLLRYSELSFLDRIRCGISMGGMKATFRPPTSLDTISAANWIRKYAGESVYNTLWGPLLEGKFSKFADTVPALWLWGRIYDRSFKLGYFDGSVKVLFDALIHAIIQSGGKILLEKEVTGIKNTKSGVYVYEKTKKNKFDTVIVTTVSPVTEKLIQNKLSPGFRTKLKTIDHLGAVCVILELKHSIQNSYWLNICEKNAPVLVMVEHTNFIPSSKYGGKHLVYLANYIHQSEEQFSLTDLEIVTRYTSILKDINPKFKKSWVLKAHVSRVPRAQTIFTLGSLKKTPKIKMPVPNIYMVNIDQMYPHDRNLNQGIQLGKKAVDMILKKKGRG